MSLTLSIVDNGDGSGATATISGSTIGSANTIYVQQVETIWQPPLWQVTANLTGDGSVSIPLAPGHYLAYCISTSGGNSLVSLPVYFVATAAVLSVKTQILNAVQVRLRSLNLAGIASNSVIIKKLPITRYLGAESTQIALPAAIIADVAPEGMPARGTCQLDDVEYPVQVTLAEADNQEATLEANHPAHSLWRQQIERAFRFQRLPGVNTIINCSVEPSAPIDQAAWIKNYYASALTLKFTSRETRGA